MIKKYKNSILLLCFLMGLTSATEPGVNGKRTEKADQGWRINFPKQVEYCEQMPSSDSLFIFFMAGQSNMAGRGFVEPQDTIPNKRILTIDASMNWVYAKEPLHFYEPKMTGLDCGMAFGQSLLDSLPEGVSIAMIPCAVGGSSINKWLSNQNHRGVALLSNFKSKVAFAKNYGTIKGILWHQGESNAKAERIPMYAQQLDSLIAIFRETVGNDELPVVIGELGRYTEPEDKQARWDALNLQINSVADRDANISVANSEGLTHKGDGTHMDSESQRELGRRLAKQYLEVTKVTK
ncbi:sialate O-acetylesterase [Reichenbachiella carrageenanivorans]|uniref:Sialate O-acetylesterase n=1 Tax=Reichenbachiella carrageenanivorans TaxID=2979869 RepID=A0ABY6CZP7_9BACT|nr:sialate O-acetylesterase [Reichenbachiella carrageenanivorans]UXX79391.1 sialate O-acetylesterase [Reichenbachiella carrageenanivorans]